MCLIAFAWLAHPRWKLVLAGNRDEFHARPTALAGWWPDAPQVFGGRDLEAGGSWLAIDRRGRLAAVTNVRAGLSAGSGRPGGSGTSVRVPPPRDSSAPNTVAMSSSLAASANRTTP